jgi:hypothetical protein
MSSDPKVGIDLHLGSTNSQRRYPTNGLSLLSHEGFARLALGVLLIVAALLKSDALIRGLSQIGSGSHHVEWCLVLVELMLGSWFLSGQRLDIARMPALVMFGAFAAYSAAEALRGNGSCGCFGRISTSPLLMFIVDVSVIVLLVRWMPRKADISAVSSRSEGKGKTTICCLLLGALGGWLIPETVRESDELSGLMKTFDADEWRGKAFPFMEFIDVGANLSKGEWTVVLYHHDCPQCQRVVDEYKSQRMRKTLQRLALIELTPFQDARSENTEDDDLAMGRCGNTNNWFISTPTVVELNDGVIR